MLLVTVVFVVRFGAAIVTRDRCAAPQLSTTGADGIEFDMLGARMSAGLGCSNLEGKPTSFRAPAFPFLLAALHTVAPGFYPLFHIVFALLGSLSCCFTYLIAREFGSERTARFSSMMLAFYFSHICFATRFDSENLFVPLIAVTLWFFVRGVGHHTLINLFFCGGALGFATLTRPFAILLILQAITTTPFVLLMLVGIVGCLVDRGKWTVPWVAVHCATLALLLTVSSKRKLHCSGSRNPAK